MPRESKATRHARIHADALAEFDQIQAEVYEVRRECRDDRRRVIVTGAQWEDGDYADVGGRPKFELNKLNASCMRIENEYRNSRLTVNFSSKSGKNDKMADVLSSLYRADEQDSKGVQAYDNALGEGVRGGMGAWRYRAKKQSKYGDEDDYQRICIEPIFDADTTVFFGLDGRLQDKSDAMTCFVVTPYTRAQYRREWGEKAPIDSWQKSDFGCTYDWVTPDAVYVAEYYVIEEIKETLYVYRLIDGEEERYTKEELDDDDGDLRKELEATAAQLLRTEKRGKRIVRKYMLSGSGILDECLIPGPNIPIVPYYGNRAIIDGIERIAGHIRYAIDAQRLMNMQYSKLAEVAALSPQEVPIFTAEQIAGHEEMWSRGNLDNLPYRLTNSITDKEGNPMPSGPIAYTKTAEVPPVLAALFAASDAAMKDILGNPQAGDVLQSGTSGKAAEIQQVRLDMMSFIYMSNLATAMKRGGEIYEGMVREVYVEEDREMKTVAEDGKTIGTTVVNHPVVEDGKPVLSMDLAKADYDVIVDVGPSSTSKRATTVRAIMGMLMIPGLDAATADVLVSFAMMNMEGEGIGDVRDFFRDKMVKMGVVKPTEEEAAAMAQAAAQAQEDPNAILAKGMAEQAVAEAARARADTVETAANTELIRAKTETERVKALETIANLDMATKNPVAPGQPQR